MEYVDFPQLQGEKVEEKKNDTKKFVTKYDYPDCDVQEKNPHEHTRTHLRF